MRRMRRTNGGDAFDARRSGIRRKRVGAAPRAWSGRIWVVGRELISSP